MANAKRVAKKTVANLVMRIKHEHLAEEAAGVSHHDITMISSSRNEHIPGPVGTLTGKCQLPRSRNLGMDA